MPEIPRHQCLIYSGSPAAHLLSLAGMIQQKLKDGHRCLYLNTAPMCAGIRSYLWRVGVDVAGETARGALILSSERTHLIDEKFDLDRMMGLLESAHDQALADGYAGLWATGDMAWELGDASGFPKLLEYEWRLEAFFKTHPGISGVCQYHADILPREVLRHGLAAHPAVFVNDTLSRINPHYLSCEGAPPQGARAAQIADAVDQMIGAVPGAREQAAS